MGSHRVRHDWSNLAATAAEAGKTPWRKKWQPTPVSLPGNFPGQRSLEGYSPGGRKKSDTTEHAHTHKSQSSALFSLIFFLYMLHFHFYSIQEIFFFVCSCHLACEIFIPWPGIKPKLLAVEAWSLSHWTAREVPNLLFFIWMLLFLFLYGGDLPLYLQPEFSLHVNSLISDIWFNLHLDGERMSQT